MPWIGDALQLVLPPVLEYEAGTRDEVLHRGGDEHFVSSCERCNPSPDVDGDPTDFVVDDLDLALKGSETSVSNHAAPPVLMDEAAQHVATTD